MSQATHTPGPWEVGMRTGHNANNVYARDGVDGYHDTSICTVSGIYSHRSLEETIASQGDSVALANARLIAAAPDLVKALERIIAQVDVHATPAHLQNVELPRLRAALAKARS